MRIATFALTVVVLVALAISARANKVDEIKPYLSESAGSAMDGRIENDLRQWTVDTLGSALSSDGGYVAPANAVGQWESKRGELEQLFKDHLRSSMSDIVHQTIVNGMLRGSGGELSETRKMSDDVSSRVARTYEVQLDAAASSWFDKTVGIMKECLLSRQVENPGCPSPVAIDVSDLSGSIDRLVQPKLLGDVLKGPLSEAIGESTVNEIQDRLSTALQGKLPPELHEYLSTPIDKFKEGVDYTSQYLPGEQIDSWKAKIMGKNIIKLPNAVYGAILASSAARHFSKVVCGPGCFNAYEFQRGTEVVTYLTWQLTNRKEIAINVGQLFDLMKYAGHALNIPDPTQWGKLGRDIAKIKEKVGELNGLVRKVDDYYNKYSKVAIEKMEGIVNEFERHLKDLQETLLTPVSEAIEITNEGFATIRDKMKNAVRPWDDFMKKVKALFEVGSRDRIEKLQKPGYKPPDVENGRGDRVWPTCNCGTTSAYYSSWRVRRATRAQLARANEMLRTSKENGEKAIDPWKTSEIKGRKITGVVLRMNTPGDEVEALLEPTKEETDESGNVVKIVAGKVHYRHDGLDISTGRQYDQSIAVVEGGEVYALNVPGTGGNNIVVKTATGLYAYYVHVSPTDEMMQLWLKKKNKEIARVDVQPGQVIGRNDHSGKISGPHLHFKICERPSLDSCFDPLGYLPPLGNGGACAKGVKMTTFCQAAVAAK